MSVKLTDLVAYRYRDPARFLDEVEDYLAKDEAAHNIFFGIIHTLIETPERYPGDNLMVSVEHDGEVVAAAFQTPPHNLVLSRMSVPLAAEMIADFCEAFDRWFPGVTGPVEPARIFNERWKRLTGCRISVHQRQRIYELSEVVAVEDVPGRFRAAQIEERERLVDWMLSFDTEIGARPEETSESVATERVEAAIDGGELYVWEDDGELVSMARATGETPNGLRINYVYTPPEKRRNGYASACVAALSQKVLDDGKQFCFLFTDLDNPTSNHIYQEIGYEPVIDVAMYDFE